MVQTSELCGLVCNNIDSRFFQCVKLSDKLKKWKEGVNKEVIHQKELPVIDFLLRNNIFQGIILGQKISYVPRQQ